MFFPLITALSSSVLRQNTDAAHVVSGVIAHLSQSCRERHFTLARSNHRIRYHSHSVRIKRRLPTGPPLLASVTENVLYKSTHNWTVLSYYNGRLRPVGVIRSSISGSARKFVWLAQPARA